MNEETIVKIVANSKNYWELYSKIINLIGSNDFNHSMAIARELFLDKKNGT